MKNVLVVIPARLGSTRFPEKILAPILGKPLIAHVFDRLEKLPKSVGRIVAVDHTKSLQYCRDVGIPAVMTSQALSSGTQRVIQVAQVYPADLYVNVQCDEALVHPRMIQALIDLYESSDFQGIATLKTAITGEDEWLSPHVVKIVTAGDDVLYCSRASIPYGADYSEAFKHVGIYAYSAAALHDIAHLPQSPLERAENLEQLRFLESRIPLKAIQTPYPSLAVDVPEDVQRVERFLCTCAWFYFLCLLVYTCGGGS